MTARLRRVRWAIVGMLLVGAAPLAWAEQVELVTYDPAPAACLP